MTQAPPRPNVRSLAVAAQGKGTRRLARRAWTITARYGVSPARMDRRLAHLLAILEHHGCSATLPITASAVERHPRALEAYAARGIEFAVHGLYHVDHLGLDEAEQHEQLARARQVLEAVGIPVTGFRAPYLRCDDRTMRAVRATGFRYDASRGVHWPVAEHLVTNAYRRGLEFYGAVSSADRLSVPWAEDGLLRIPYSLPDDESLVERLPLASPDEIARVWADAFRAAHAAGELFTVSLHPERVEACTAGIDMVLAAARAPGMRVWIARLDEIARWWTARGRTHVEIVEDGVNRLRVRVTGPPEVTVLVRGGTGGGAGPWEDGYVRTRARELTVPVDGRRPFVGVHPACPAGTADLLRDQGYVVETTTSPTTHTRFVSRELARDGARAMVDALELPDTPLVRLGRWPDGARSAVAVTGDVDALTLGDFAWRVVGR